MGRRQILLGWITGHLLENPLLFVWLLLGPLASRNVDGEVSGPDEILSTASVL